MTSFDPRLLTPPREEEEITLYRPVWRSVAFEIAGLFLIALGLFFFINVFGIAIPTNFHRGLGIALALLPLGLWIVFSLLQERRVPEPRLRLLAVVIISALVANGVGIPLVDNIIQPQRWLPLTSALNRILGYAFTVGIFEETLKFLVVRYVVRPDLLRTRLDSTAYCLASAIGYATVLNLHYAFNGTPPPDNVAAQAFANIVLHFATSMIVSYGLSELYFSKPTVLLLPTTLSLSALIAGVAIPIRAGLVNASLDIQYSLSRPLFGFVFSLALIIGSTIVFIFLFNNAERQAQESIDTRG